MKKWLFFIVIFVVTIIGLVLMTSHINWFQSSSQQVIPQQTIPKIETTLEKVQNNLIAYRINKLSYEVKKDYGWRRDYLADQLSKMNLKQYSQRNQTTEEFYNTWIKVGSDEYDQKFVIYCQGWDDESNVCFLTLAQKISELNTKKSYTFIIQRDIRLREPTTLIVNILKNELRYTWSDLFVLRRLNLSLINQDFDSYTDGPRFQRFISITPKGDLSDEPNTILKMCNFNLHIVSLYEDDYFDRFHRGGP